MRLEALRPPRPRPESPPAGASFLLTGGAARLTTHTTLDDAIASGLARTVGASGFLLWHVFKMHADYKTGLSWPGWRRIQALTGFVPDTVTRLLPRLVKYRLLRRLTGRERVSSRYLVQEVVAVRQGEAVIAALVFDYVPNRLSAQLAGAAEAFEAGRPLTPELGIEVWPAPGYLYDTRSGLLHPTGVR